MPLMLRSIRYRVGSFLSFGLVNGVGKAKRFLVDQLLECLLGQIVELHGDAEWFFGDGLRGEGRHFYKKDSLGLILKKFECEIESS